MRRSLIVWIVRAFKDKLSWLFALRLRLEVVEIELAFTVGEIDELEENIGLVLGVKGAEGPDVLDGVAFRVFQG